MLYLIWDFIINIDKHSAISDFLNTMFPYSFYPFITKPTSIKGESATLIDNIYCNNIFISNVLNGIFYTDISDHFPIFTIIANTEISHKPETFFIRQYHQVNIDKFSNMIKDADWSSVLNCDDCQSAITLFHDIFCIRYDHCFPLTAVEQNYRNRKSWLIKCLKIY